MLGLGIDLGTANTVVCRPGHSVVLDEPSVMLLRAGNWRRPRVSAVGRDARSLVGRTPTTLTAIRPLQDGVITDLETARAFLMALLRQLARHRWQRLRTRAVIGVPLGATALERRALSEAAEESGIAQTKLLAEPIAGAIGCGIDPMERKVHMVVDIGGGTAEVTAFCYGSVLAHRSCRVAGDEMTLAVYHHLREEHQLLVGELVAEDIKIRASTEAEPSFVVEGRDAGTGRPRLATVTVSEVAESMRPVIENILRTLAACLDDLPPQSVGDVMAEGILVFGGGSLTRGFDALVERAFGFSVKRAGQPLTCVAEGAARCLGNRPLLDAYTSD